MITLYTTGCPKCNILKTKLKQKNIEYQEFTDENEMIKMGFKTVPYLDVDGKLMNFSEANNWVNKQ